MSDLTEPNPLEKALAQRDETIAALTAGSNQLTRENKRLKKASRDEDFWAAVFAVALVEFDPTFSPFKEAAIEGATDILKLAAYVPPAIFAAVAGIGAVGLGIYYRRHRLHTALLSGLLAIGLNVGVAVVNDRVDTRQTDDIIVEEKTAPDEMPNQLDPPALLLEKLGARFHAFVDALKGRVHV